ncbi:clathrin assembly [Micractinium conductrix]|uniref:Clathrin assembly n=1 Tax=Micractinium conductrix TaxID=554055 RepID=A0A2P6VH82_9CHLO|nr:clathrin assembly [Micractinium conductrix]|eukprot:PSC73445.1 clathrin assembly [Micractinium conductrix]
MADAGKTSVAGSLSTTFSEKLRVASAKVGGDHKDLNVAIIKATTSQFHVVPKEKHVRTLKLAVNPARPHRDIIHVITELHRRLQDATDWLTALKSLITLHRLMRESEPRFMEELAKYSDSLAHSHGRGAGGAGAPPPRLFCTDNFIDRTTSEGRYDFSEWVRAYGKYLEEQLTVYSAIRWGVEQEGPGVESRLRGLPARDLLFQLPHLQRLQRRQLDCMPRGAATHDPVVLFALSLVLKESFQLYKAVSEGVINLAGAFFEMEYHDATHGLELYKESVAAAEALTGYYTAVEQIEEIRRSMQLPKLNPPPADFLASMEAYVAEAPRPLAEAGAAAAPAGKRGVPLRKGKLLQGGPAVLRTGSGLSAGAAAGAPRDPGMVLPFMPSTSAGPATSQSGESRGRGGGFTAVSPTATAAASEAASAAAAPDLLGGVEAAQAAQAAPPPAAPKPAPSPLDLLSGLDFTFPAEGGVAPAAAPASSNPFADLPVAPTAAPAPLAAAGPATGSSNPFGEPSPTAAAPASYAWAAPQQPAWGAAPPQPQYQQQQPAYGYGGAGGYPAGGYGAPQPVPAGARPPHLSMSSDDPFASFGAPPPAAAATPAAQRMPPAGGAFWAPPQPAGPMPVPSYGAGPHPLSGDELSKAALNDPFAALTGLPKSSPGASTKPSPPRQGMYPTGGFL